MKKLHVKSSCCRGRIIKFGRRRRQCIICKATWRIRKKKRGRKAKRVSIDLFEKYFNKSISSLYSLAKNRKNKSEDQLQRNMRRSLISFVRRTPWVPLPYGEPLIIIADAMIININKRTFTFYFLLLRPVNSNQAIIIKPYIKSGGETGQGWEETLQRLPEAVSTSICTIVSDGHGGLLGAAKRRDWIIQRCHFHIIARIQGRRSRWIRSRHRAEGETLNKLVNRVLTSQSSEEVLESLKQLGALKEATNSKLLRQYLSGFIKQHQEFRSYLKHPHLNIPRTSNSAEAVIGQIRTLCRRAHGFRTIYSLKIWVWAWIKYKKYVACNGFLPTKLTR